MLQQLEEQFVKHMAISVNLLPKKVERIQQANKIIGYLMLGSKIMAGGLGLALLVVFGWFFITNWQLGNIGARVDSLTSQIQEESETEKSYRRFKDVLSQTRRVLGERRDFASVNELSLLLPMGVAVQGITFGDKIMMFEGKAEDVQALGKVLSALAAVKSERLGDMAVKKIQRDVDGSYTFSLEIMLKVKSNNG